MAGTKPNYAGGSGFKKPKQDKDGSGGQPMGPATDPLWDLFNLLIPTGGGGLETTVPKGGEPRQTMFRGGDAAAPFSMDNTVQPGRIPGAETAPAPQAGVQPPSMMAQPTQSVQAQPFNAQNAFGGAFDSTLYNPPAPPMPAPNPARPPQGWAPPMSNPMPMPTPNPAFHAGPEEAMLTQFLQAVGMPQQNPAFHPSPMSGQDPVAQLLQTLAASGG